MSAESPRPAAHFTAARNWLNDPNGLLYAHGEYHLFFQYNPRGDTWANMSWGHAVSPDLTDWTELPVAIEHEGPEMIFSGSAVLDRHRTSGFGTGPEPPIVAVHTVVAQDGRQTQAVAWSGDRGRTFTRDRRVVLASQEKDFRDPKVFWHAPSERWVMALVLSERRVVQFFASADLLTWEHLSDFGPAGATGGIWECPDLSQVAIEGSPGESAWVLVVSLMPGGPVGGSGSQYFVGDFDGTTFTATHHDWLDHGSDNYAGVTFNDAPHDARVMIAWMSNHDYANLTPTRPWRGAMTVPRALSLRRVDGRLRLVQRPMLVTHGPQVGLDPVRVDDDVAPLPVTGSSYLLEVTFVGEGASRFGVLVAVDGEQHTRIGYDVSAAEVFVDRRRSGDTGFHEGFPAVHRAPVRSTSDDVRLQMVVDTCSVEVFADDGTISLTDLIFPENVPAGLAAFAEGGRARCAEIRLEPLTPNGVRVV